MEVRVSAAEGTRLPDGCVINVGVGDIQKQARYDPKKLYRFTDAKRVAKVDVYRLVGSCDVKWNLEEAQTMSCTPMGTDGDTGIQLAVSVTPVRTDAKAPGGGGKGDAPPKPAKADTSARARKYLQEQNVEAVLTNAMRALLQTMPQDSTRFLADYITTHGKVSDETSPHAASRLGSQPCRNPLSASHFGSYYLTNVVKALGPLSWSKIYCRFPSVSRLRPTPGSSTFGSPSCPLCYLKQEEIQRLKHEISGLRAGGGSRLPVAVPIASPIDFRDYYRKSILPDLDQPALNGLYRNFQAAQALDATRKVANEPSKASVPEQISVHGALPRRKPFSTSASVGTWLARPSARLQRNSFSEVMSRPLPVQAPLSTTEDAEGKETEAAAARIQAAARGKTVRKEVQTVTSSPGVQASEDETGRSVQTALSAKHVARSPSVVDDNQTKPFFLQPVRPSVGTWLQVAPPKPQPTFRHKPSVGTWLQRVVVEEDETKGTDSRLLLQTMLFRGPALADFGLSNTVFIL
eukprot:TRINITY_DN38159_c0_g1_i1.p1 TRINITY_DN38159_c0_g1~~TRINITY_DN38159_c0_g1_i1.p1  ORF type:complete len:520 (-),score=71.20 TRINITY_DN38159_c0_g1_i1:586-2145(-)